jgi:hypothetical protein
MGYGRQHSSSETSRLTRRYRQGAGNYEFMAVCIYTRNSQRDRDD